MTDKKTIEARFAEAWGAIENPELDGRNPHFGNTYATLKATLAVIRDACRPQGLVYQQSLHSAQGNYYLESCVRDGDGGIIELSEFPVETPPNPQTFGSELTYKKRQQAQADWGITGEDDEDGEAAAAAHGYQTGKNASAGKKAPTKPSGGAKQQTGRYDRLKQLKAEAMELGITEEGMQGAIGNVLQGKPMKDASDTEIKACEACIAQLVSDKRELMGMGA